MNRRTAILLFGFMAASIVGYAAWAARDFVERPPLSVGQDVPEEAAAAIRAWQEDEGYFRKEAFSWRRYLEHLQKPWQDVAPVEIAVRWIEELPRKSIYAYHHSKSLAVVFSWDGSGWVPHERVPSSEILSREQEAARRFEAAKAKILNGTPFLPDGGL